MKIKHKIYIIFTLLRYITGYRVRPIPIHAQANAILNVEVPVLTAIDDEVDRSPDGVAWRSKQYSVEIPCQQVYACGKSEALTLSIDTMIALASSSTESFIFL
jgi:hypothetical protein